MNKKIVAPKNIQELLELIKMAKEGNAEVEFLNAGTGEMVSAEDFMKKMKSGTVKIEDVSESGSIDEFLGRHGHTGEEHCPACEEDVSSKPTSELANKLLEVVVNHQSPVTYKPGQFVRYRERVHYVRNGRQLHCVVENINPPRQVPLNDENEGSPTNYRKYDILVATESRGGICVYLADSREMEIYPDADRLLGKKDS